ncbi:MAG TPA: acyltransferase [Candidatus Xenobia bacterium]
MAPSDSRDVGPELIDRFKWEPGLDVLRALAVLHVMLYHAGGEGWIGFWGVDLFFVLSGFLITTVLLKEIRRRGGLNLPRFYVRRVLRLYPALAVLLVVGTFAWFMDWLPCDPDVFQRSTTAAIFYVLNLFVAVDKSTYSGWGHLWSLCIEEQYYLLWPATLWWISRRRRPLAWGTGLLVLSTLWLLSLLLHVSNNAHRIYYATDARAMELLAGSVCALLPLGLNPASLGRVLAWADRRAGLVLLALVGYSFLPTIPWRLVLFGHMVIMSVGTSVVLLSLAYGANRRLSGLLSRPWLIYVGRLSYSLYLWNWPIALLLERRALPIPSGLASFVLTVLCAMVSYHAIEQPVARRFLTAKA